MDPHRHRTTTLIWGLMIKPLHPHPWSPNWRTCMIRSLGCHGSRVTDTWLTGQLSILTVISIPSYLKTHSDSPLLKSKRQARKFDKGMCVFNTLAFLKCDVELHVPLTTKGASKPAYLLKISDSDYKHQTVQTHKGVCILNTLVSLQYEFDTTIYYIFESAGKPVSPWNSSVTEISTEKMLWFTSTILAAKKERKVPSKMAKELVLICCHRYLKTFKKSKAQFLPPTPKYNFIVELITGAHPQEKRGIDLWPAKNCGATWSWTIDSEYTLQLHQVRTVHTYVSSWGKASYSSCVMEKTESKTSRDSTGPHHLSSLPSSEDWPSSNKTMANPIQDKPPDIHLDPEV